MQDTKVAQPYVSIETLVYTSLLISSYLPHITPTM